MSGKGPCAPGFLGVNLMKEQKSERPGLGREGRFPSQAQGQPQRSGSMMQTDVQMRKSRGRLSRHVQNKLGETLHAMFDEIVKEGVPDRFSQLLEKINGGKPHGSHADDTGDQFSKSGHLEASGSETEPVVRARVTDRPFRKPEDDKGSS
jgi:hypothetical protein